MSNTKFFLWRPWTLRKNTKSFVYKGFMVFLPAANCSMAKKSLLEGKKIADPSNKKTRRVPIHLSYTTVIL